MSNKMIKRVVKKKEENNSGDIEDVSENTSDELPITVFGFISNDLNSINIEKTYNLLKSKMKLGDNRLDVDVLSEAVDAAPEWAFKAAQLHIIAKDRLSKFENITFKLEFAKLSEEASMELEKLKKKKELSGQVTKEKIENWIILNKPEYKKLLQEKRELEMAVEAFKSLSSQFESKKSLLQTQGRIMERKKVIVTKGGDD